MQCVEKEKAMGASEKELEDADDAPDFKQALIQIIEKLKVRYSDDLVALFKDPLTWSSEDKKSLIESLATAIIKGKCEIEVTVVKRDCPSDLVKLSDQHMLKLFEVEGKPRERIACVLLESALSRDAKLSEGESLTIDDLRRVLETTFD